MQCSTPIHGKKSAPSEDSVLTYLNSIKEKQKLQRRKLEESINQNINLNENKESANSSDSMKENIKEHPEDSVKESESKEGSHLDSQKPKFPYLKKGQGTKRFNFNKRLKKKSSTVTEYDKNLDYLPSTMSKKTSVFSHAMKNLVIPAGISSPDVTQGTEEFEALEKLTEQSSFCSNISEIERINSLLKVKNLPQPNLNAFKRNRNVQFNDEQGAQVIEYALSEEDSTALSIDNSTEVNASEIEELIRFRGNNKNSVDDTEDFSPIIPQILRNITNTRHSSTPNKVPKPILTKEMNGKDSEFISECSSENKSKLYNAENDKRINNRDLECEKILLISKVNELDHEIKEFKKKNAHLERMKEIFLEEKELWNQECEKLEASLRNEKLSVQSHFRTMEKRASNSEKKLSPSLESHLNAQIVNLKEEIIKLKREISEKESKSNQIQTKWKRRVLDLQSENDEMRESVAKTSALKKENIELKHKLDRLKLSMRAVKNTRMNHPENKNDTESSNALQKLPTESREESQRLGDSMDLSPGTVVSRDSISYTEEEGSTVIKYSNGNKKTVLQSGKIIHEYYNGDRKEILDDKIVYTYAKDLTKHTVYRSGVEEIEYSYGQKEVTNLDGSVEIFYPDSSRKFRNKNGSEIFYSKEGTKIFYLESGEKVLEMSNGQIEVHGSDYKKKEYTDGTVKTIYADGSTQVVYPDGSVKIKNKRDGN